MGEPSVVPSAMVRSAMPSGISRLYMDDDDVEPARNMTTMQYCTLCVVAMIIIGVFAYAFFLAFVKNRASKEEPPLMCSLDGHHVYRYPVEMCSYIIFLSAVIDLFKGSVDPLAGTEQQYDAFMKASKSGDLKKLLSFRYDDVNSMTADDISTGFVKVRSNVFHGVDFRFTQSNPTWLKLLTVEAVSKYSRELVTGGKKLASSAWHCIGLSLAAVAFQSSSDLDDDAVGVKRLSYCEFDRNSSERVTWDPSYFTRTYQNDLVVFEKDKEFSEKLKEVTKLSKSCVLLDDVFYDYHKCQCDKPNFKLLRAARRVLWGGSTRLS
ncbi:hypothetical protein HPB52_008414 [Rhipicephalus sanguineus]|uniref:Uncharacterized protein n=1 Tax=Rhipicephalus sanguineus TaxID=34632 RepID=A0A9D4Q5N8_RHISA|nr:hypothetical protein HPB52_008414 [Rhipicephalus sanguineus]